jgi:hypothetical protein
MGRLSLPRQLASAAVVVALVLSMAGCRDKAGDNERGDGGGNEAAPAEPAHDAVMAAATKLRASDVNFTVDVTVTGWNSWHTRGTGRVTRAPHPSMAVDFPGMPIVGHWLYGGGNIRLILIDHDLYVHIRTLSPREQQLLTEESAAEWERMDLSNPEAATLGLETVTDYATQYTPDWQLEMLLASKDLTRMATEMIDGVETTRYEGTLKLSDAAGLPEFDRVATHSLQNIFREAQADQARYVVWLDAERRLRRIVLGMRSNKGVLEMTMDVARGGTSAPISAPPKSAIHEMEMP